MNFFHLKVKVKGELLVFPHNNFQLLRQKKIQILLSGKHLSRVARRLYGVATGSFPPNHYLSLSRKEQRTAHNVNKQKCLLEPCIKNKIHLYYNLNYSQSSSKFSTRMLSLRKSNFSRVSGDNLALLSAAIRPAAENSLSTSVEVGGGVRNFLEENNS